MCLLGVLAALLEIEDVVDSEGVMVGCRWAGWVVALWEAAGWVDAC